MFTINNKKKIEVTRTFSLKTHNQENIISQNYKNPEEEMAKPNFLI